MSSIATYAQGEEEYLFSPYSVFEVSILSGNSLQSIARVSPALRMCVCTWHREVCSHLDHHMLIDLRTLVGGGMHMVNGQREPAQYCSKSGPGQPVGGEQSAACTVVLALPQ